MDQVQLIHDTKQTQVMSREILKEVVEIGDQPLLAGI